MDNRLDKVSSNELTVQSGMLNDIVSYMPEHRAMIDTFSKNLPELHRSTSLFCKTQSQYMDNVMTIHHPTPVRNLRQILAELEKTIQALREAHFARKKTEVEIQMIERVIPREQDDLKKALLEIELEKKRSDLSAGLMYISGAIRKITNYNEQYNSILASIGVKRFDEIDFEKEEDEYHIKTVFTQALSAARARGGVVDEGNFIYLQQCGINGTAAAKDIAAYFDAEAKTEEPTYEMELEFLDNMFKKYQGSAAKFATRRGQNSIITEYAALKEGLQQ